MKAVDLKRSWHHLNRYQEILKVFVKYGFWDIVERIRVRLLLDISKIILPRLEKKEFSVIGTSVRLRLALKKLSPTFIKLVQMLSLRPDLISPKIADELTKLQDEVAPLPFALIQPYIEKEYNKPLADIFAEFNENTIAAASLTQVHKIKLKSKQEVAVKIIRPNIQRLIETDLGILHDLAELILKYILESKLFDPLNIIQEFAKTIRKEHNMEYESHNIDVFQCYLMDDPIVKLP